MPFILFDSEAKFFILDLYLQKKDPYQPANVEESLVCGALSGICSKGIIYPLDMVKKRLQVCKPLHSHECQKSKFKKNPKFHFVKFEKQVVPRKSTAKEVSFEWLHDRISSINSKVRSIRHVAITDSIIV